MVRSGLPSLEIQSSLFAFSALLPAIGGRGQQGVEIGLGGRLRGLVSCFGLGCLLLAEEPAQVGLGREPRDPALHGSIGLDLGRVEEELLAPHQPCLDTFFDDPLEEATEDEQAVALADAGEAGVVGKRLLEIVAEIPAQGQARRDYPHQLALGADVLEEHEELEQNPLNTIPPLR